MVAGDEVIFTFTSHGRGWHRTTRRRPLSLPCGARPAPVVLLSASPRKVLLWERRRCPAGVLCGLIEGVAYGWPLAARAAARADRRSNTLVHVVPVIDLGRLQALLHLTDAGLECLEL